MRESVNNRSYRATVPAGPVTKRSEWWIAWVSLRYQTAFSAWRTVKGSSTP
jgi:hypothetical protein